MEAGAYADKNGKGGEDRGGRGGKSRNERDGGATRTPTEKLGKLKQWISDADFLVVGAGAGLSAAAGFAYSGARFHKNFADFEEKYGFHDMYSGGFYPFPTEEEYWAYWSRFIFINRYGDGGGQVYADLLALVKDKNYFVITTNVDHLFQKSGFDKTRLFYTQGDYGLFQCSAPCRQETYDNEKTVREMFLRQKEMKVPAELFPRCPVCGRPMSPNLRVDGTFVENEGWRAAYARYKDFLEKAKGGKILFLEAGVGMNTPGIVKYPFWRMTAENKNARYACLNLDAYAPGEIAARSVCVEGNIGGALAYLRR